MSREETLLAQLEEQLRFETLVADLSSKFIHVASDDIGRLIEEAQRQVCDCLGLDVSSLWQWTTEEPNTLVMTHLYRRSAGPATPQPFDAREYFPWALERLKTGQVVALRMSYVPPEAARDLEVWLHFGVKTALNLPLVVGGQRPIGLIGFNDTRREREWADALVQRLQLVAQIFANALGRLQADQALARSCAEIKQLKDQLQTEADYLKAEIKVSHAHGEIIGRSRGIREVLQSVEQVAPADCPVLISGETGTGKELIAQEIHRLSLRNRRVMVLVNCAALPTALVESELFGRERGAYTGAMTSQVGRFEVADGSTIFLDEVGELSMEVQAKLLRVLQYGEFERLGSPKTHKVDVRVVAATNRDLAEDVRKGRFREDLYYRLKVFPIEVPPLRERVEDIPALVFAFLQQFSGRMGKKITKVPRKAMGALQRHSWPGNIRELRNVIEHSTILSSGDTLALSVLSESPCREPEPITLEEAERDHISKALEKTSWRIKGPYGAAQRLGMQPSTLYSRMHKLGIPQRHQKEAVLAPFI